MRRLLVIASTMVLFDVAFYSAIAPLLPDYVDELGLSKAGAGILSAAYAAGTLVASLPAGLLAAGFAVLAWRTPESPPPERQTLAEVGAAITTGPVLTATAFVAAPSLMFGAIEVLVPLRIDDLGGGHALIAAAFIVGAGIEAALAPISGRYSDRVGRRTPFVAGLAMAALGMAAIGVAQGVGVVVVALQLASFGAGLCFTPALTMLAETSQSGPLQEGLAAGLSNMAWALGQVVGGLAGGGLASAAGYAAPSLVLVAMLLCTAAYARSGVRRSGVPAAV
jgi:MFS family permease